MTLTPDQLTWTAVSGGREVTRLPSHFVCLNFTVRDDDDNNQNTGIVAGWNPTSTRLSMSDMSSKVVGRLRSYIDQNFSGRYFVLYNGGSTVLPSVPPYTLLVAFEDPAEASFFSLQFEYLLKKIIEACEKKK